MAKDSFGKRMPWFRLWAKDFMADPVVQGLSWDQRGRYLWALMCSWETDLPGMATEDQWMRWMGVTDRSEHPEMDGIFIADPDGSNALVQKRLVFEYLESKGLADKRSRSSLKANGVRWDSDRVSASTPPALREHSPASAESDSEESKSTHSSPNGSENRPNRSKRSKSDHPVDREWMETFDDVWWPEYLGLGRHCSKAGAREVWARIPHTDGQADFDRLSTAFDQAKNIWRDERRETRHLPHADKWLRDYIKNLALEA